MDMVWWWVGGAVLSVLVLGLVGARVGKARGGREEGRRAEDARDKREMHDAFEPPKWWEKGKARDQADYFSKVRRANGQADASSLHALSRVVDGERKRKERRWRVFATAVVLGGGLATALVLVPAETKRAFELFSVPVLFVVGGVVCNRLAVNRFWYHTNLGMFNTLLRVVVAVGQAVLPLVGVVLGVMAAGEW
jgi:hypothetical protein